MTISIMAIIARYTSCACNCNWMQVHLTASIAAVDVAAPDVVVVVINVVAAISGIDDDVFAVAQRELHTLIDRL